jgi:lipoprotein NlpD
MVVTRSFWKTLAGTLMAAALLCACGSKRLSSAPVDDRGSVPSVRAASVQIGGNNVKPQPGQENAGKPGYYTVKSGETLIRIGLESGQNWKDIARWNNMDNPNQIEAGQVLRVAPPPNQVAAGSAPVHTEVVTRPIGSNAPETAPATAAAKPAPAAEMAAVAEEALSWSWPTKGPVLNGFDEVKNKGLDIGGTAGDPVLAAADGRVVYAGSGLRGYGNLVILKHNNTYLTAYAHNQSLLVKEDQVIKRGQKIAEMGSSDADRVKLHFEVRRQGKPVDPSKFLPAR